MPNPSDNLSSIQIAIAQCLAWKGDSSVNEITESLKQITDVLEAPFEKLKTQAQLEEFITENKQQLWDSKIGLVYGGATKIKGYVFESADLQEIRGASALLDRINLIDLPAFFQGEKSERFEQCQSAQSYCERLRAEWLQKNFPTLENALTPEMLIYSTGGNILALCPSELVNELTNAIEKRYTIETLTANACAVGAKFSPLEIYLGLLKGPQNNLWLNTVANYKDNQPLQAYFGFKDSDAVQAIQSAFMQRKGFSELTGKLANQFNQRRSGYEQIHESDNSKEATARPSRRYPPMFETHPYLMRDDSDQRSLVLDMKPSSVLAMNPEELEDKLTREEILPDNPKFSEPSARKRWIGQVTKRENSRWQAWYRKTDFIEHWNPIQVLDDELEALGIQCNTREERLRREDLFRVGLSSWVNRLEQFLFKNDMIDIYDPQRRIFTDEQPENDERPHINKYYTREARSLTEIGAASNGYVAYIYADGNNMGAYIRDEIKTPERYQEFSQDIFNATQDSVYWALAHHIRPCLYTPDAKSSRDNPEPVWIHPFEIIAIGGDDVLLIVPANKALEVAKTIGEKFEEILEQTGRYSPNLTEGNDSTDCHRFKPDNALPSKCRLSISSGVLITAENTPIYYADKLVSQLLKSAKKKAKDLRDNGYYGGTVDFLTLKAVTMISSNIDSFRKEGLTVRSPGRKQDLKLYAAPYTLHELGGLIETIQAVKESGFPKSQLYQIRTFLEQGKRTAILNYRYFKVRLQKKDDRTLLKQKFEEAWCNAETNNGNLAPWMTLQRRDDSDDGRSNKTESPDKTIYETLWRELVELYEFIEVPDDKTESHEETSQSLRGEEVSS
ncbi:MAG: type III-B CRISPR-associated protein Cas10/Cmr2 [Cyanobacteria bacterium J06634_5]